MKKILIGLIYFIFIISLSACVESGPEETIKLFLNTFINNGLFSTNEYVVIKYEPSQDAKNLKDELNNDIFMFFRLTYEIGKVKIEGDIATVEVSITQINNAKIIKSILDETSSSLSLLSELPEDMSLTEYTFELYKERYNSPDAEILSSDVAVILKKINGSWLIDDLENVNASFFNSISGGTYASGNKYQKIFVNI
ncbi:MAG: hypothetical protein K0S55_418 [Clostridia bacterium]|jgi:hypothetical protein|nr:hypothetical protein [Clostridia bacterium]